MTIDDELILELVRPNRLGEVGDDALLVKIVGTKNLKYSLEEPTTYIAEKDITTMDELEYANEHLITPDMTIVLPRQRNKEIAIELENDVQWDFGQSLRQIKKYRRRFSDVRVIIPKEYERFAPLYLNEGVSVYLWKAERMWQCLKCGNRIAKEGPIQPQCECKNKSREEFRLVGLKNADIEVVTH